jgi:hypothetical protein
VPQLLNQVLEPYQTFLADQEPVEVRQLTHKTLVAVVLLAKVTVAGLLGLFQVLSQAAAVVVRVLLAAMVLQVLAAMVATDWLHQ